MLVQKTKYNAKQTKTENQFANMHERQTPAVNKQRIAADRCQITKNYKRRAAVDAFVLVSLASSLFAQSRVSGARCVAVSQCLRLWPHLWRLSRGGGLIGLREGDLTQRARELQGALFEAVADGLRPCSGALRRCD